MKLQLFTLARDIFKMTTSQSFSQKGFTQVAQVQISPDAGDSTILTLVYQLWAHQF